jgi:uncharacterized protein
MMQLTPAEQKTLKKFLALAGDQNQVLSFDELTGFLFGLAMTPETIAPDEWLTAIFGGPPPRGKNKAETAAMLDCLFAVYNRGITAFQANSLLFPFDLHDLSDKRMEQLYEWVSGFEEAVALREELWDPEEHPELPEQQREQLYHAMLTIQGLVDPSEVMEYFDNLSEELFQEVFPDIAPPFDDREAQVQMLLLASLPLTIATLIEHARTLEGLRRSRLLRLVRPLPPTSKGKDTDPCSCTSRDDCSGCGSSPPSGKTGRQAKVISVDFRRKKRTPPPE